VSNTTFSKPRAGGSLLDRIVYWLFRLTILVTRPLPLRLGYRVGGAVSVISYRTIFRGHRKALMLNLSHVLGTNDQRALDAMGARTFRNFAKYVIDFINFPSVTRDEVRERLRFDQWDELNAAANSGRGVIMASLHFGNWDLAAASLAAFDYKINAIAETFAYPPMNDLVQGSRTKLGLRFIGSERTGPSVFRALRRGEMLAMLVDVVEADEGIRVDCLGAPALVSPAAARIALRTGAWVVPAVLARDPDDDMIIRPYVDTSLGGFVGTGDEQADAAELTRQIMQSFEPLIRAHPDQWFVFRPLWDGGGK
jgi:KDO2-lipid IV(A) lauroyltransferase